MFVRGCLIVAVAAMPVAAQPQRGAAASRVLAPGPEARQFDFLVGQWELVVSPKVSSLAARIHGAPKLAGSWKAWRAFDGFGLEDELRIVDGSGNPASLSHAMRVFDPATKRWLVTALDVYRSRFSTSTAEWSGTEMVATGTGTDAEGRPIRTRTRFSGIGPDGFVMTQDRSTDDGGTWEKAVLTIQARRVAATGR